MNAKPRPPHKSLATPMASVPRGMFVVLLPPPMVYSQVVKPKGMRLCSSNSNNLGHSIHSTNDLFVYVGGIESMAYEMPFIP